MNNVRSLNCAFACVILLASFALIGCDSNDSSASDEISEIDIQPESASLAVGEREDFSIVLRDASGDPAQDADFDVRWWSTDTTVFDVNDEGAALAKNSGSAYCMVEVTELAKAARFTGRDSAFVTVLF